MQIPSATYRIQFNPKFRFTDAENLVPYLHRLGISHLYSSPYGKARKGSLHGYDVADPLRVNSEIGSEDEFSRLVDSLHQLAMGLLLDIVPNHMAASTENPWWMDVLENGRASAYGSFFDIDWDAPMSKAPQLQRDRVVLPVLTDFYERVLTNQEVALHFDENGFYIQAQGNRVPLNPRSYPIVLDRCREILSRENSGDEHLMQALQQISSDLASLPSDSAASMARHTGPTPRQLKADLWRLSREAPELRKAIDQALLSFHGAKGDLASFAALDRLLGLQAYRLAYWRTAADEVNYRRFFGLNDLVSVRVEDPEVFATRHALIFRLLADGKVSGLRVDHVDGLRDPRAYLARLQAVAKPSAAGSPVVPLAAIDDDPSLNVYTVVEKITAGAEVLPPEWFTAGTTGYDFLNAVNTLFIDPDGSWDLETFYRDFTGIRSSFTETWYVRKKQVMEELFSADVRGLAYRLRRLAAHDSLGRDIPRREIVRGLKEITACLPIYRTYCRALELSAQDRLYLQQAFKTARRRAPQAAVSDAAFDFLRRVFLLDSSVALHQHEDEWLDFLLRWQQFSGGVMAKGLEDTAFYVHHGLISLNEVGCNPFRKEIRFGVPGFHHYNKRALKERPFTLNATSTHDTKWSEDVRARINVLSEIPDEWKSRLRRWVELNQAKKTEVDGRLAPSPNEEVLLYQSMLGIWPLEDQFDLAEIRQRLQAFLLKASREAKTHSSWISPNEAHEAALQNFIAAILDASAKNPFLSDFRQFAARISLHGATNSLAQLLLKITAPGVPDFYQGNDIWNFRLTDPDNRGEVDFQTRARLLGEIPSPQSAALAEWFSGALAHWRDGRIKLALAKFALNFRLTHRSLFLRGNYIPLEIVGGARESVVAFARSFEGSWIFVAAPRFTSRIPGPENFPIGADVWRGSSLLLPARAPHTWSDVFAGQTISLAPSAKKKIVPLADVFRFLPFALFVHESARALRPA